MDTRLVAMLFHGPLPFFQVPLLPRNQELLLDKHPIHLKLSLSSALLVQDVTTS